MASESRYIDGTACYAGTRLEALLALQERLEVVSVITVPGSRVHQHRLSAGQETSTVTKDTKTEAFDFLAGQKTDLVLSVGFPFILPSIVLNSGPAFINSHPSLLPAYKGYDAIKQAFRASEEFMGVSVHYMNEDVDSGTVIHQEKASVSGLELGEVYALIFGQVEPAAISAALDILLRTGVKNR